MDNRSPDKKKRPTLKDFIDQAEPYHMPPQTLKPTTSWLEEATVKEQDIRLFQETFRDEAGHQTTGSANDPTRTHWVHKKAGSGQATRED